MVTTTNVPSDNFEDLLSDVRSITKYMNGDEPFQTRTGRTITPIPAQESLVENMIRNSGWMPIGTFAAGATIVAINQVLFNAADDSYYNWNGELPFTVLPGTDPVSNIGPSAWMSRGGILNVVAAVGCIKDLGDINPVDGQQFSVAGFYSGSNIGGGSFRFVSGKSKSEHNGGTVIAPEAIAVWDGSQASIGTLLNWMGSGAGCYVRRMPKLRKFYSTWFGATTAVSTHSLRRAVTVATAEGGTAVVDCPAQIDGSIDVSCNLFFNLGCPITQLGGGYNMLNVVADNVTVDRPQLVNAGVKTTLYSDVSVYLNGVSGVTVRDGAFRGHRSAGVGGVDNDNCTIIGNAFTDSPVDPTEDNHTQSGGDIYLLNRTFDCLITRNFCLSGAGIGIAIQSVAAAKDVKRNKIYKNVVNGHPGYGIMLYRVAVSSFFDDNLVDGNTVENISGQLADAVYGNTYGAGIYIQAADNTTVINNSIGQTNTSTAIEMLAPAAIGVNLTKSAKVLNNRIRDCAWYGVIVLDPFSLSDGRGDIDISGNHIQRCGKTAVYVKDVSHGLISRNTIDGVTGGHGVRIANTTTNNSDEWRVSHNVISGASANGITVDAANYAEIESNRVQSCGTHGVSCAALYSSITNNNIKSCPSRGIEVRAAVADGVMQGNRAKSCGTSYHITGVIYDAEENTSISHTVAKFGGTYYPTAVLPDGATNLVVGGNKHWVTLNSAPTLVTGIVSHKDFQKCQIRTGDANTTFVHSSAFRLSGSVNFVAPGGSILIMQRDSATTNTWYEIGRFRG